MVSTSPCAALQAERVDVGDQHQQAGHLLAGLEDAELAAELDRIDVVGRAAGDADDLRLRRLRLENERGEIRRGERMRTEPSTLPPFCAITAEASRSSEWPNA